MKLKLIYTGNPQETKVINSDTGEIVENVVSATVNLDAFGCHAIIEVKELELELDKVETVVSPYGNE